MGSLGSHRMTRNDTRVPWGAAGTTCLLELCCDYTTINCLFPMWLVGYCSQCLPTLPIPLRFHNGKTERLHQLNDVLLWWMIFTGFYSPILFSPVVWFGSVTAIYRKQQNEITAHSQGLLELEGRERQVSHGRVNNWLEPDRKLENSFNKWSPAHWGLLPPHDINWSGKSHLQRNQQTLQNPTEQIFPAAFPSHRMQSPICFKLLVTLLILLFIILSFKLVESLGSMLIYISAKAKSILAIHVKTK